jgi:hypothetical protein
VIAAAGAVDGDDDDAPERSPRRSEEEKDEEDGEEEQRSRFWEKYDQAPLDDRLEMAQTMIGETADFDGELGFELVEPIAAACQKGGRIAELEQVISRIEQRHPEAFAAEAHWFQSWRVENALLTGGDVRTPLLAFAARADHAIDELFRLVDRLLYHGREVELVEALGAAWPILRDCDDLMDYGKVELQDTAQRLILHRHLVRKPDLSPDDPELLSEIEPYREGDDHPWWNDVIEVRTGRHAPEWSRAQFAPSLRREEYERSVFQLSEQFAMALEQQHAWPHGRAELARAEVFGFFSHRGQKKAASSKAKKARRGAASPFSSMLTPESADEHMAGYLDLIGPRPYRAASFALALPHLLSFLVAKGLLDAGEARYLDGALGKRCEPLVRVIGRFVCDPLLVEELRRSVELHRPGA